jgi:predicted metalloprotease
LPAVVKYRRGQGSSYVNDQRGRRASGGAIAGGGGVVAIVIALIAAFAGGGGGGGGIDLNDVLSQLGAPAGPVEADPNIESGTGGEADDETEDFMRAVMNSLQDDFWPTHVDGFQPTSLVLFTDAVDTACGRATSAVGPFYCPGDSTAYIDLAFFDELRSRFGADGEFAQAYVIAHEVGHHIQNLQGTSDRVHGAPASEQEGAEGLSVRTELQADCYAGLWAGSVFGEGSDIEVTRQDIADALEAAEAIGDDRLQEQAGGQVNPETWTHGSSAQRQEWFERGFDARGDVGLCDTFNAEL